MVSLAGLAGTERTSTIARVAAFLEAPKDTVTELLEEGRLERALLTTLRGRGVAVTPKVKNSVQMLVRTMEPRPQIPAPHPVALASPRAEGTATIMFTDIVDSSALIERLGDREGRRVLSTHNEIIRHQTDLHDGIEVKSMGDGFMLTFRSAHSAVACAIAVQRALAEYNKGNPDSPFWVRVGLSVGEPQRDSDDLYGMSVNMAARIASKAQGGQVLISEIAHTLTSSSGDFDFQPVGPTDLKGIAGSHQLFEVLWKS